MPAEPTRRIPFDQPAYRANAALLWLVLGGVLVVDAAGLQLSGLGFSTDGALNYNTIFGFVLLPFGLVYTFKRFDERLASLLGSLSMLLLLGPTLCLFTYVATVASASLPLQDTTLARFDEALGFHWPAYLAWFDAHPILSDLGLWAYRSIFVQAGLLVVLLTLSRQAERLQAAILVFVVSCLACGVIAAMVPALGAYSHYGVAAAQHPHIRLIVRAALVPAIMALRGATPAPFSLAAADGIITFPSFHAALGVLFVWGFWRTPVLRWAALGLNAALLFGTPVQGSHYLVDILAGVAIAIGAIGFTVWVRRRTARVSLAAGLQRSIPSTTTGALRV